MLRLLAFALFMLSIGLLVHAVMLHMNAERVKSLVVGIVAAALVGAGLLMILDGG